MRFLADENVSHVVVRLLRLNGFDVATLTTEQCGSSDEIVLGFARTIDCIVLTEDRDFGELVIRKQLPIAGVVLLELDRLSNQAEADRVLSVIKSQGEQLRAHLTVVEPSRTRIRPVRPV